MTRTIGLLLVAALALAAVSTADSANEFNNPETFEEAESFVQAYTTTNKKGSKSACDQVADDSINEIKEECKKLQNYVNGLAKKNGHCCREGQSAVAKAKSRWEDAKSNHKRCKK